ncbi:type IV toxin-antitoxin system AbiEi family antitoxin domain-containing protein [Arthrobacter cupressi]|uniref:Transcriptional regulator, AbiEi antitoxin, Type IV TA system n=1 Tax=Arthrobacter cupressi TaxID=1045773 RepID=A0A1G8M0Y1_9MICC|nr:type IV toxin-antitoxin system AbiEi family antitoxin domain-containing protein [Arthrobacter cupressi]SDI61030.1 Transcriptional regulator, AbiEi antitoxin, Type IV TA system [Arthrobacter cupressi]
MTLSQPPTLPALPESGSLWRTEQLQSAGLNSRAIAVLVRHRELVRLRYGCYIRASLWNAQEPWVRSRQLILAHAHGTRTTSDGAFAYSHTSAARIHGLFVWNTDDLVHILLRTRPSGCRLGKDVRGHTRPFTEADVVTIRRLRVTSLERTAVDCALMLNYRQSLIIMDNALRQGADPLLMQEMAAAVPGRRGVKNLRRVLENADPRSESAGETLTRELLQRLRIPMPDIQLEVMSRAGRHRMDFGWKARKIALEFDGRTKYFDYAPTPEVLYRERQRENALTEDGWMFVRLRWQDLFNEEEFKARILTALLRKPEPRAT